MIAHIQWPLPWKLNFGFMWIQWLLIYIVATFNKLAFGCYFHTCNGWNMWSQLMMILMIYRSGDNTCREPRGFGFVKFRYAEDAAAAKQQMNHQIIGGREISIVFAEENRKTPQEMRMNARIRCSIFFISCHHCFCFNKFSYLVSEFLTYYKYFLISWLCSERYMGSSYRRRSPVRSPRRRYHCQYLRASDYLALLPQLFIYILLFVFVHLA